jgi:hypothetical protein
VFAPLATTSSELQWSNVERASSVPHCSTSVGFDLSLAIHLSRCYSAQLPRPLIQALARRWLDLRIVFAGILEIMNDGFSLFNPPPPALPSSELLARLAHLEGRLDAFKRHTYSRLAKAAPQTRQYSVPTSKMKRESIVRMYTEHVLNNLASTVAEDKCEPISLTIHTRVKWEFSEDYEQWQVRI